MVDAKTEQVHEWITKARHDLATARKLALPPDPILDTAIYHCQQAAEKMVKGFLLFHDIEFEKTHDIRLLVEQAIVRETKCEALRHAAVKLTPYVGQFRYPGAEMEPTPEQFAEALLLAQQLTAFVESLLPKESLPI